MSMLVSQPKIFAVTEPEGAITGVVVSDGVASTTVAVGLSVTAVAISAVAVVAAGVRMTGVAVQTDGVRDGTMVGGVYGAA